MKSNPPPATLANSPMGAVGLRRLVAALLLLWLLLAPSTVVHAQYTYTATNNQITLTGYTGTESVLILPATINQLPVTCLGASAFHNSSLTGVTIPNSVTSIGPNAFDGSTRLTSVKIGDSVTNLGVEAFYRCSGLTNVSIPNSVTSIEDYTFQGCTGLTRVTIPKSVTSIGVSPFMDCTSLTEINVDSANSNYSSIAGVLFDKAQGSVTCRGSHQQPLPTRLDAGEHQHPSRRHGPLQRSAVAELSQPLLPHPNSLRRAKVAPSLLPQNLLSRARNYRFVHVGDGNRALGAVRGKNQRITCVDIFL